MPPSRSVASFSGQDAADIDQALRNLQQNVLDVLYPSGNNPHANLAIAGTATKVKTSNAIYGIFNGALMTKAATDNLWTLAGTVTNAKFNVFVLTIDVSGNANAFMGTEGATLAAIVWPAIPQGQIVVGVLVVNPTGTGNFIGATTAINDATVVPNAVFINTMGDFNPNNLSLPNNAAI